MCKRIEWYENSLAVYPATFAQPKRRSARQPNRSAAGLRLDLSSEENGRSIIGNFTLKPDLVKVLALDTAIRNLDQDTPLSAM